jgi:hypothetical protein
VHGHWAHQESTSRRPAQVSGTPEHAGCPARWRCHSAGKALQLKSAPTAAATCRGPWRTPQTLEAFRSNGGLQTCHESTRRNVDRHAARRVRLHVAKWPRPGPSQHGACCTARRLLRGCRTAARHRRGTTSSKMPVSVADVSRSRGHGGCSPPRTASPMKAHTNPRRIFGKPECRCVCNFRKCT